jgi:biopolymer transport protein ExbB
MICGCFDLTIPPGSLRCEGACPGGMECVGGLCWPEGWRPEGGYRDSTTLDQASGLDVDAAVGVEWWDKAWSRRRRLTFKNAASKIDLDDFPVLVALDSGRVDYGSTGDKGKDIRFVDADGKTLLAHEIEAWNPGGRSFVWVRVPRIDKASATDFIWLYHGNPAADDGQDPARVWHPSYQAVWHLHDGFEDSTVNKQHATNHGSTSAAGVVGDGQAFSGQGQYIDTNHKRDLTSFTLMVWARGTNAPDNDDVNGPLLREENYQICWDHAAPHPRAAVSYMRPDTTWRAAQLGLLEAGTWYLLSATFDGGTLTAFVNGKKSGEDLQGTLPPSTTHTAKIGRHAHKSAIPVNFFEGLVDEVRIADAARPADWIAAQHASMTDGFVVFGGEEKR